MQESEMLTELVYQLNKYGNREKLHPITEETLKEAERLLDGEQTNESQSRGKLKREKKITPYQVAVKIIERHERFLQISYRQAPSMTDCGRYFINPEEDIIDDGFNAGVFYHSIDGGEGPFYSFLSSSFEEETND